jgi:hypothetical protein
MPRVDVETIGLQKVLKFVTLRLEIQSTGRCLFANVASSMAGEISAISLAVFLVGLLTVRGMCLNTLPCGRSHRTKSAGVMPEDRGSRSPFEVIVLFLPRPG